MTRIDSVSRTIRVNGIVSPWIGNISPDPKLTIKKNSYHQTESPSISVKKSLSSLRFSYPNLVLTPLNTNYFTSYGPTFTLVINYLQGSVRRFSRLHDSVIVQVLRHGRI